MSSGRLVQFIGVVLLPFSLSISLSVPFSLSRSRFLSRRHISILLSVAPRWFQRNDGGGVSPGEFCPSFVSSSNYDLPHEYEPYVNIYCALPPPSFPVRPIPSFGLLFLPLSLVFASFSFFLSLSLPFPSSLSLPHPPLPRRGRHFVHRGVANASAMTAAYSQND